jgi:hypothetical protein
LQRKETTYKNSNFDSFEKEIVKGRALDKAFNKSEYYLTCCKEMEQKYGKPFADFQGQVEESKEEVFDEWDDLIEWEAYELAYKDWQGKYEELKNRMTS